MRRGPAADASRSVRLRIGVARPMRGRLACGRGCDALRSRPGPGAERPGGDGPARPAVMDIYFICTHPRRCGRVSSAAAPAGCATCSIRPIGFYYNVGKLDA